MPDLAHTTVYRGGVTAHYRSFETQKCSSFANPDEKCLEIRFNLASKGGGTTSVLVQIGIEDMSSIFQDIATAMPESVTMFAESAAVANARNLEMLGEARRLQNNDKAHNKALAEKLDVAKEFLWDKHCGSEFSQTVDKTGAEVYELVDQVRESLWERSQ